MSGTFVDIFSYISASQNLTIKYSIHDFTFLSTIFGGNMKAVVRILKQKYASSSDFQSSEVWRIISEAASALDSDIAVDVVHSEKSNDIAIVLKSQDPDKIQPGLLAGASEQLQKVSNNTRLAKEKFIIESKYSYDSWIEHF